LKSNCKVKEEKIRVPRKIKGKSSKHLFCSTDKGSVSVGLEHTGTDSRMINRESKASSVLEQRKERPLPGTSKGEVGIQEFSQQGKGKDTECRNPRLALREPSRSSHVLLTEGKEGGAWKNKGRASTQGGRRLPRGEETSSRKYNG